MRAAVIDPATGNVVNIIVADAAVDKIEGFSLVNLPDANPAGAGWKIEPDKTFIDLRPSTKEVKSF